MSNALTLLHSPHRTPLINELTKNIKKIVSERDLSIFAPKEAQSEFISDFLSTFLITTSAQESISELLEERKLIAKERNEILSSFIKRALPSYKKRLKVLDTNIDEIDLQIYYIQEENMTSEAQMNEMVKTAENSLSKYSKYLPK